MLEKKAAQIRLDVLNATYKADMVGVGSRMSIIEIMVALYYGEMMKFNEDKPGCSEQDYFILSKARCAPVQYAILADLGFFDKSELDFVGKTGAMLPECLSSKVPGVSATVIGEGMGLSVALGIAMSLKMERKANRVYALLGDSELKKVKFGRRLW